jgi:hypothetical protein
LAHQPIKRSKPPKRRRKRPPPKPKNLFLRALHASAQKAVRMRLDYAFFVGLGLLALGMVGGLVLGLNFDGEDMSQRGDKMARDYSVPVRVIDKKPTPPKADEKTEIPLRRVYEEVPADRHAVPEEAAKAEPEAAKKHQPREAATAKPAPAPARRSEPRSEPAPVPRDVAWLKFAAPSPAIGSKPAIAIILDDLGIDQRRTKRALALPAPITMAFLP